MSRQNDHFRTLLETTATATRHHPLSDQVYPSGNAPPLSNKKRKKNNNIYFAKDQKEDDKREQVQSFVRQEARDFTLRKLNSESIRTQKKKGDEEGEYINKVVFKKGKKHILRKRISERRLDTDKGRYVDRAELRRTGGVQSEDIMAEFEQLTSRGDDVAGSPSEDKRSLLKRVEEIEGEAEGEAEGSTDFKAEWLIEAVQTEWNKPLSPHTRMPFIRRDDYVTYMNANEVSFFVDISNNELTNMSVPEMVLGSKFTTGDGVAFNPSTSRTCHPKILECLGEVLRWHRTNKRKPKSERVQYRPGHTTRSALYGMVSGEKHPDDEARDRIKSDSEDLDMFGEE
eukprot:GHVH01006415.1.p1 GENE.GHVH01006415.1~~GHVH01006415.1.p1  ORF type:complete len:342 (+),score=67.38 GHVH01006415.1:142-1167(+)